MLSNTVNVHHYISEECVSYGGRVWRHVQRPFLIRHLDDFKGGFRANHIWLVLILSLRCKQTNNKVKSRSGFSFCFKLRQNERVFLNVCLNNVVFLNGSFCSPWGSYWHPVWSRWRGWRSSSSPDDRPDISAADSQLWCSPTNRG